MPRNTRTSRSPLALLVLAALLALLTGCESDPTSPAGQDQLQQDQPPVLPDPGRLAFDLHFFDSGESLAATDLQLKGLKTNFINAFLRVVVIDATARLLITPPLAAFALALHTIPSPQEDGSWIWVYTYVNGDEELQIRLRGETIASGVAWQMRVHAPQADPPLEGEIWFEGLTRQEGQIGEWTFHDPARPGDPEVAELVWGPEPDGAYLLLTCLEGADAGNSIVFHDDDPAHAIVFTDADNGQEWFIKWNEMAGTGSLQVPDYHGGQEACWDEHQNNVECR
jgi:hypothetical protein